MAWLRNWLRQRADRKRPRDRRTKTVRPAVAELETRTVPAAVATNFINHGGPVLAQPQIEIVYYGQAWNSNPGLQTQINTFVKYLGGSSFMDVLSQYGVSHAQVAGSVVIPDALGGNVTPNRIQNALTQDIANGTLPPAGNNRLYLVFTPPNVTVKDNPFFPADFLGYHSSLIDNQGNQDAFAVIPVPGGSNPQAAGLTSLQSLTDTTSHEVAEAVTDPFINAQGNPSGWDDYTFDPNGNIDQGEIGDVGATAPTVYLNGYAVTQLWSNSADSVVAPAGATSTPTASTLTVTAKPVTGAVAKEPFTAVVATVTDAATNASVKNLTATIDWGDHTTPDTNVGVTTDSNGNLIVQGTHTYSASGSYTITVTVTDSGSGTTSADSSTTDVAPQPTPSVDAQDFTAQTGQPFTGTVAKVSDRGADPANLTATIDWGDKSTPDANVKLTTDSNGNLIVQGTHTYAAAGSYAFSVTVTDGKSGATDTSTSTATVATPGVPAVTGLTITPQSGQSFTGTVATVSDLGASASDLTATIDWGDKTTPDTKVPVTTDKDGNLIVQGTHTYATGGQYTVTVTVTDSKSGKTATGTGTANVAAPGTPGVPTVTGQPVLAVTGQPFVATVATVTDPGASHRDLVAMIDWGDGSWPSWVRVESPDAQGNFTVEGFHRYDTAGNYTITVTVYDRESGSEGKGTATANVADSGSLSVTTQRIDATAGTSFTGTVATVTGPGASASELTATINWGDGQVDTNVKVTTDSNGNLIVQGTHTYAHVGNYGVTVTVSDTKTGNRAQDFGRADVDPAATQGNLRVRSVDLRATAGQSVTDGIAVVFAPGARASDLSVKVNWGDGTTDSNVQVVPFGIDGLFIVTGTHTYTKSGQFTISVTVSDSATSATDTSSSTAFVDAAAPTTGTTTPTTPTTPTTTTPTTTAGPTTPVTTPPTETTTPTSTGDTSQPTTPPPTAPTATTVPTVATPGRASHHHVLQQHPRRRHH
jgi:hypothetical protein